MLAVIVADTKKRRDPLGYFAALYRQVTLGVKNGIEQGTFDDGPRMTKFDAAFANAYFTAYDQYRKHERPSRVWQSAFDSAASGGRSSCRISCWPSTRTSTWTSGWSPVPPSRRRNSTTSTPTSIGSTIYWHR